MIERRAYRVNGDQVFSIIPSFYLKIALKPWTFWRIRRNSANGADIPVCTTGSQQGRMDTARCMVDKNMANLIFFGHRHLFAIGELSVGKKIRPWPKCAVLGGSN